MGGGGKRPEDAWADCPADHPRRGAGEGTAQGSQLSARQRKRDLIIRALAAGIPLDEVGQTKLHDIERRWQAVELQVFMQAKTQLELELLRMSARSLGEADEETETDDAKLKEKREKQDRWEARGDEIKAEMREKLLFSFMPDYMRAGYVTLHGWPGKGKEEAVEPLEGVSQRIAQSLLKLITAQTFSRGGWTKNKLHEQLQEDGRLARKRLELTARGE